MRAKIGRRGEAGLGLPDFDSNGLLPPNDYEMTLEELASSMLVEGPEEGYPSWDRDWRARLVENLGIWSDSCGKPESPRSS